MSTVFTQISAAALIKFLAPQVRRLIEGGAYLKFGPYKKIFPFNLKAYLQSVRENLQLVTEASFHCHIHLFRHFSVLSSLNSDRTLPFCNNRFLKKDISSAVLDFLYSGS